MFVQIVLPSATCVPAPPLARVAVRRMYCNQATVVVRPQEHSTMVQLVLNAEPRRAHLDFISPLAGLLQMPLVLVRRS